VVDAKEWSHPTLEVLKDAGGTALGHVHYKNGQWQVLWNDQRSVRIELAAFDRQHAAPVEVLPRIQRLQGFVGPFRS